MWVLPHNEKVAEHHIIQAHHVIPQCCLNMSVSTKPINITKELASTNISCVLYVFLPLKYRSLDENIVVLLCKSEPLLCVWMCLHVLVNSQFQYNLYYCLFKNLEMIVPKT